MDMAWLSAVTPWVPVFVSITIAVCGWFLLLSIAKRRESYDLCVSVIGLLERLEAEVTDAWSGHVNELDKYSEQRLASYVSNIEQRVRLLQRHYHQTGMIEPKRLRRLATFPTDLLDGSEDRQLGVHRLVTDMISTLLEDNYQFINRSFWKFW